MAGWQKEEVAQERRKEEERRKRRGREEEENRSCTAIKIQRPSPGMWVTKNKTTLT
jgi:hypothetical protein